MNTAKNKKVISTMDMWTTKMPAAKDIDNFIKISPKESQAKLKQLRLLIKTTVPEAEEGIRYRMPVFKLNGKSLVGFAGYRQHIGFYPMSGSFLDDFKKELKGYETSKGTIRFSLDKPLPVAFIKRLVKARMKGVSSNKI